MRDHRFQRAARGIVSAIALLAAAPAWAQATAAPLPEGLFSAEPALRAAAIAEVEKAGNASAIDKLALMARGDPFAEVREAACRALGALGATGRLGLLDELAAGDANDAVRAAAARAARLLRGEPEPAPKPPVAEGPAPPASPRADDAHKAPEVKRPQEEAIHTRHFAFGFGTMGGYGIAAFNLRGRIPVPARHLPWIGVELGGGWTPPQGYVIVSGLMDTITDRDVRWKLISGAAALLFYLHRSHYLPLRGGFDIGQGPYIQAGYGFEMLNDEGFLSWGAEVGLHVHPVAGRFAREIVDPGDRTDGGEPTIWPVAPFVRFSLHFYPI